MIQFSSQLFSNRVMFSDEVPEKLRTGSEVAEFLNARRHWRVMVLQAESIPSPQKYVTRSTRRDRFGDPYAHVHYEATAFDHETYGFARELFDRFKATTGADEAKFAGAEDFTSGHHHMGTCRMGQGVRDSVVNQFGKIHGTHNLFVVGGSNFVGPSAVNPTLTMVALAIRTGEYILDQLL
jgi:choline dehydrogenase-like flavoprotein